MTQDEFEHIAPALRELMLSVGRSFFGNDDDAEDVAQEGLVALLRFIDRMESGVRHDALAIRVAKHCCMDMVRKRKSERKVKLKKQVFCLFVHFVLLLYLYICDVFAEISRSGHSFHDVTFSESQSEPRSYKNGTKLQPWGQ